MTRVFVVSGVPAHLADLVVRFVCLDGLEALAVGPHARAGQSPAGHPYLNPLRAHGRHIPAADRCQYPHPGV
jgi:hypothetical protein